ncbi:cytochrome c oxidase assembly protein [Calidifontibacter indicus]|uniref:cytochrome c oxidase assembly protein n=1 Tax=Calidifontibacter indicus TaxID=419650 RepID=UPI003D71162E
MGSYEHVLLWCFGVKVATLVAVTPFGLAIGVAGGLRRLPVHGRWSRAVSFPLLSSVVAAASVTAVFFTGYSQAAVTNSAVDALLVVHLLVVGLLVTVPLLSDDLLPGWATPPVRALLACVDGLLDALPGILVMTSTALLMPHFPGFTDPERGSTSPSLDQKWAGGALIAVAEVVGLPMLLAVFAAWVRHDQQTANQFSRNEIGATRGFRAQLQLTAELFVRLFRQV